MMVLQLNILNNSTKLLVMVFLLLMRTRSYLLPPLMYPTDKKKNMKENSQVLLEGRRGLYVAKKPLNECLACPESRKLLDQQLAKATTSSGKDYALKPYVDDSGNKLSGGACFIFLKQDCTPTPTFFDSADVAKRYLASAGHKKRLKEKDGSQPQHSRPRLITEDLAAIGSRLLGLPAGTAGGTGWAVSSSEGMTRKKHVFDGRFDAKIRDLAPSGEFKVTGSAHGKELQVPTDKDRVVNFNATPSFSQTLAPLPAAPADVASSPFVYVVPSIQDLKGNPCIAVSLVDVFDLKHTGHGRPVHVD